MGNSHEFSTVLDNMGRLVKSLRDEREALVYHTSPDSPADGCIALAYAFLADEEFFQQLPNNAMEDAAVMELASQIEHVVTSYIAKCRYQHEHGYNGGEDAWR